mmetsp:Transcript_51535/g.103500  ORF Transcript_51535/g.103500 Transcript_51535/m.103500 type:complete len:389 (+) Transcript_51535:75-1241(+)
MMACFVNFLTILLAALSGTRVFCTSDLTAPFSESQLRTIRDATSMRAKEKTWPQLKEARTAFTALYSPPLDIRNPKRLSILFIGDSIFRNQFQGFCLGILEKDWNHITSKPKNATKEPAPRRTHCKAHIMHAASDSSFEAECHGMWGAQEILALYVGKITFEEANVARVMALAPAPWTGEKPGVIYFGAGQWLMWPVPFVTPASSWTSFDDWRCLEADVEKVASRYQRAATSRVVTASVHPVCDGQVGDLKGEWLSIMDTFRRNETEAAASCAALMRDSYAGVSSSSRTQRSSHHLSSGVNACKAGFRRAEGAIRMNSRLAKTVAKHKKSQNSSRPEGKGVPLGFVDAHAIMDGHCDLNFPKSDRIHFTGLVYDELGAFLREIDWPLD